MSELTPLTCQETFERLDDYLDRELTPQEVVRVEEHLRICAVCAREYRFEAGVIDDVRSKIRRIKAPDSLRLTVQQLLSGT